MKINREYESDISRPDPIEFHDLETFSGQPIVSDECLDQMVETLGIIIDRCPKGKLRKRKN